LHGHKKEEAFVRQAVDRARAVRPSDIAIWMLLHRCIAMLTHVWTPLALCAIRHALIRRQLVDELPKVNYDTLAFTFIHLAR
jgi:hypothetical protein